MRRRVAGLALTLALALSGCGGSEPRAIRIGVLVDCTGIAAATHDWTLAAAGLPLLQHGGRLRGAGPASGVRGARVASHPVEIVEGCTETGVYSRVIAETRRLVEVEHVDAVVGGLGWNDGAVVRELARRSPTVPFLLVDSWAGESTWHAPAANLYRFGASVEQEQAGLAAYAYRRLGWRRAATVAEDEPNGWGGVAAFAAEFCALGGQVQRVWTPYYDASLAARLPPDVDGTVVFANAGPVPPTGFLRALARRRPDLERTLLVSLWVGTPGRNPELAPAFAALRGVVGRLRGVADPTSARDAAYRTAFAAAFPGLPPGIAGDAAVVPYHDAMQALLQAIESTDGELGQGRARLRAALDGLRLAAPGGTVRLDANRQAVVTQTLVQLDGVVDGRPAFHRIQRIPEVDATLDGLFGPESAPGRDGGACRPGRPPRWAR